MSANETMSETLKRLGIEEVTDDPTSTVTFVTGKTAVDAARGIADAAKNQPPPKAA